MIAPFPAATERQYFVSFFKSTAIFPLRRIMVKWGKEYERIFSIFPGGFGFEKIDFN